VAAYLAMLGLLGALGMVETRSQPRLESGLVAAVAAVIVLFGWGVQALGEEVVYRGWLLQVVAARTNLMVGVAVSTAIFTVTHFIVGEFDVVLLVNLALFGVFWSLWAVREGGLWGVFGWHAAMSWVSENLVVVGEGAGYGRIQEGLVLSPERDGTESPHRRRHRPGSVSTHQRAAGCWHRGAVDCPAAASRSPSRVALELLTSPDFASRTRAEAQAVADGASVDVQVVRATRMSTRTHSVSCPGFADSLQPFRLPSLPDTVACCEVPTGGACVDGALWQHNQERRRRVFLLWCWMPLGPCFGSPPPWKRA
jgi:hypothetical protein